MVSSTKTPEPQAGVKAELHGDVGAVSRTRKSTKGKQRPTYRRRVKPPYSYAELITMAIKSSRDGMMTLREIVDHMSSSYECFRGTYIGWKNSVRHNLSANDSFVKVLRNTQRPYGKDNFWTVRCPNCMTGSDHEAPCSDCEHPTDSASSSPPGTSPPHPAGYDTPSPARSSPDPSSTGDCTVFRSAEVPHWPSPTPGCTPKMEPLVPHHMDSQNFDDWTQLDGLFRPDTDFDLALYKDGLDFADSHQAFASIPVTPHYHQQSPDLPHHPFIKTEPSSPQPCSSPDVHPFNNHHHDAGANVYQRGIPSLHMTHFPYFQTRERSFKKSECRISGNLSSRSARPQRSGGVAGHCFREATARQPRGDGFGLGAIVASAIRGSLSLDLDESALQAIERSVRLLDQPRSTDFFYVSPAELSTKCDYSF